MKFRRSAPTVLILAILAVLAVLSAVSIQISRRMTASFEEGQFRLMGQITQSKLHGAEGKAASAAETILAVESIRKAFVAKNREELLALTKGAFAIQHEKYGISQAQFHDAPATSFLRIHNPKHFGDDQSKFRQIVVDVNRNKATRKGIEITTSGVGVFATVPVADNEGKHAGSFETALEFGPLLDELKKTYGFELAIFIEEKALRETATSLRGDVLNENNRVGAFIKFYSTHPELLRALVTDGEIGITEDKSFQKEVGGVPYGVLLQPVYNYAKKQIGVVAVANNFSATRSAEGQALVWQCLLGLVSFVVLLGFVVVVIRGLLLRPVEMLAGRMASLARGDVSQKIEDTSSLCDEMRQLVESYEQIRQNGEGKTPGEVS